jgi:hypothetical protein
MDISRTAGGAIIRQAGFGDRQSLAPQGAKPELIDFSAI